MPTRIYFQYKPLSDIMCMLHYVTTKTWYMLTICPMPAVLETRNFVHSFTLAIPRESCIIYLKGRGLGHVSPRNFDIPTSCDYYASYLIANMHSIANISH